MLSWIMELSQCGEKAFLPAFGLCLGREPAGDLCVGGDGVSLGVSADDAPAADGARAAVGLGKPAAEYVALFERKAAAL